MLGAGAWGTALALTYATEHQVSLWSIDAEHVAQMQASRTNEALLPGFTLPESISVTADLAVATRDADLCMVATPVAGLRPTLKSLHKLGVTAPVLWVCKGFEAVTGKLPHQVAEEELSANIDYGVLTGPSFAEEVARGMPCAITLASQNLAFAQHWAEELHHGRLRLYANDDIIGAEVGAAVKNVLAIAAGISDGLGFGYNSRAALITRGLAEMARLAQALGGRSDTLMGLAGAGDLILTCTGDLSRNRSVGLALAQGRSLPEILQSLGHVAEGVLTTQTVVERAKALGIDMPIANCVNAVLTGRMSAHDAVEQLMTRDLKIE